MSRAARIVAILVAASLLTATAEAKKPKRRPPPRTHTSPPAEPTQAPDVFEPAPTEPEHPTATPPPPPTVTPAPTRRPPPTVPPPSPPPTPPPAPPPSEPAGPPPGSPPPGGPPPGGPPPGGPPPGGPPKGPPPQYIPPWLMQLKIPELIGPWGHMGYDLNYVKGLWHASESFPMDRGFHVGFGPDDRFLIILNLSLAARFIEVHNGLQERGHSFAVERLVLNIRGNFMTPRIVYLINLLALTSLGSTPFLLDAVFGFSILPRKIALLVGQFPTDVIPQAATVVTNYQLTDKSLATRFFWVDRSIGAQALITPSPDPNNSLNVELGFWNHTIEQGPLVYNQFNPDLRFMYTLGIDYSHGPNYGVREGDFPWSIKPRMRLSLRGMYADVDTPRAGGQAALVGRIVLGHVNWGIKTRGISFFAGGFARWEQFTDRDPDILDFGMHAQAGVFVVKHLVEIVARYSQIWPDIKYKDGPPRNLPTTSILQPKVDVLEPLIPSSKIEAGGGIRIFPTKDPMFNLIAVYLYRDVDSSFVLQVNGWI